MAEGTNVFFIDGVQNKVAESCCGGLVFHEFVLVEGELAGYFNLSLVGGSDAGIEARVGWNDEGYVVGNFLVFFGGNDKR